MIALYAIGLIGLATLSCYWEIGPVEYRIVKDGNHKYRVQQKYLLSWKWFTLKATIFRTWYWEPFLPNGTAFDTKQEAADGLKGYLQGRKQKRRKKQISRNKGRVEEVYQVRVELDEHKI